ncbi:hypothetical protein [Pseudomonas sp. LAM2023]|uniref:hypothetical protein n=1 Tax=Pseudomonas sp. LAM2023 TaxID=2800477 RepID=UPI001F171EAB|nr:hypothetical protein [Pseudomonas sp. LAM2023]
MRHTPTRIDVTLKLDTARSPLPHKQELLDLKQQVSAFNATHVQSWPTEKANVARLLAASDRSLTAAFDEQLYLAALAGRAPRVAYRSSSTLGPPAPAIRWCLPPLAVAWRISSLYGSPLANF